MIKNYFKTAFRNLERRKSQAFLNITGLSVGFAAFLLIFLVIHYEQSFDTFHANSDRIYRVVRIGRDPVNREYRTGVPVPVTEGLRSNYPQLAGVSCITTDNPAQVIVSEEGGSSAKKFKEDEGVFVAEPQFFGMFAFPLVAGDYNSLNMPNTMFLTQSTANRYFGDWHVAMGRIFKFDGIPVKVTGILKDIPANSDFPIKEVLSYTTLRKYEDFSNWGGIDDDNYCFIKLKANESPEGFIRQLDQFTNKYIKPINPGYTLSLQPLKEIHYDARYGNYTGHVFSKDLIFALSAIGIFLLVIACVNFVNLSTAQAVNRAREVGVRKVLGGNRQQLIAQFLGEAAIISLFALIVSILAAVCSLPVVNNLLDIKLAASALYEGNMIVFIAAALVAVTLLSGFYPAFLLSGFNAAKVLKSSLSVRQEGGISLRRGLVVLQFGIAQALIIATLVVASQMNYFNHADMGFSKDAIITADFPRGKIGFTSQDVLRNELLATPGIEKVSFSSQAPAMGGNYTDLRTPDNTGKEPNMEVAIKVTDTSYFGVYHIPFVAGRCYFERDTTAELVVNQSVARKLGYQDPQQAIGKLVNVGGENYPIVGVVKDFHIASFRDTIFPVVIACNKHAYGLASIKVNMAKARSVIASMQKIWDKNYPDFIFEYAFLDQSIAKFYTQENQLSQLYKLFAAIAIFISCLGLYGLISFMALQRKKEIGIRKVLGAPIKSILVLLSKEFTLLIGIAFVISAPAAWYFMHQWLQQYPYRIYLGAWFFIATIGGSVLIAWLTVGYTAIKAARANPVKSLRTE
jgi:ABC-type antimicrobial peptide transport system permease subunit